MYTTAVPCFCLPTSKMRTCIGPLLRIEPCQYSGLVSSDPYISKFAKWRDSGRILLPRATNNRLTYSCSMIKKWNRLNSESVYPPWFQKPLGLLGCTLRSYVPMNTIYYQRLKKFKWHIVFDVCSRLHMWAAHLQLKTVYSKSHYVGKYIIFTINRTVPSECNEDGSDFNPRTVSHTLFSMSAVVQRCWRPTYSWKLCIKILTTSGNNLFSH